MNIMFFLLTIIILSLFWSAHSDYRKKDHELLKEVWEKYKGDKSNKCKDEYDQRRLPLVDAFLQNCYIVYGLALLFSGAAFLDWLISVVRHYWK